MKLTNEQRRVRRCKSKQDFMDYLFDHLIPTLEEDGAGAIVDDLKEAYYWLGTAERKPAIVKPEPSCTFCGHWDTSNGCLLMHENVFERGYDSCVRKNYKHYMWSGATR